MNGVDGLSRIRKINRHHVMNGVGDLSGIRTINGCHGIRRVEEVGYVSTKIVVKVILSMAQHNINGEVKMLTNR